MQFPSTHHTNLGPEVLFQFFNSFLEHSITSSCQKYNFASKIEVINRNFIPYASICTFNIGIIILSFVTMYCGSNQGPSYNTILKISLFWAPVTHACNPSFSGGRNQEDRGSKPAQVNSLWDPISKKPFIKKGWWSGSMSRPWVQTPIPQNKWINK
jgi:hypothetical protein